MKMEDGTDSRHNGDWGGGSGCAGDEDESDLGDEGHGHGATEMLDMKGPAPVLSSPNEYEDIIAAYETKILRLERLNATLNDNVAELLLESQEMIADENVRSSSARNVPQIEEDDDMMLTEEHYIQQIEKLTKSIQKMQRKLDSKQRLVGQLSINLKTAAEKVHSLGLQNEQYKKDLESVNSKVKVNQSRKDVKEAKRLRQIHSYQKQVLQNELMAFQYLIRRNESQNSSSRKELIDDYRSGDAIWNQSIERPENTLKRVIRQLRSGEKDGVDEIEPTPTHASSGTERDTYNPVINSKTRAVSAPPRRHDLTPSSQQHENKSLVINIMDSVSSMFGPRGNESPEKIAPKKYHPAGGESLSGHVVHEGGCESDVGEVQTKAGVHEKRRFDLDELRKRFESDSESSSNVSSSSEESIGEEESDHESSSSEKSEEQQSFEEETVPEHAKYDEGSMSGGDDPSDVAAPVSDSLQRRDDSGEDHHKESMATTDMECPIHDHEEDRPLQYNVDPSTTCILQLNEEVHREVTDMDGSSLLGVTTTALDESVSSGSDINNEPSEPFMPSSPLEDKHRLESIASSCGESDNTIQRLREIVLNGCAVDVPAFEPEDLPCDVGGEMRKKEGVGDDGSAVDHSSEVHLHSDIDQRTNSPASWPEEAHGGYDASSATSKTENQEISDDGNASNSLHHIMNAQVDVTTEIQAEEFHYEAPQSEEDHAFTANPCTINTDEDDDDNSMLHDINQEHSGDDYYFAREGKDRDGVESVCSEHVSRVNSGLDTCSEDDEPSLSRLKSDSTDHDYIGMVNPAVDHVEILTELSETAGRVEELDGQPENNEQVAANAGSNVEVENVFENSQEPSVDIPESSSTTEEKEDEEKEDDQVAELPPVDFIPVASIEKSRRVPRSTASVFTMKTAMTDGTHARIAQASEDKRKISNSKLFLENLARMDAHRQSRLGGADDDDRSSSHYRDAISRFADGTAAVKKQPAALSRRQLYQRVEPPNSTVHNSSSCSDLYVDLAKDILNPEERQLLVTSKDNEKYLVPRYRPPVQPPDEKKSAPLFKKGLKDGFYLYESSSGNKYSGMWKDGRRHGYGIAKYRDGEVFSGEWRRGRRHGHGVLHLKNKEVFDGDWQGNKKHGLGQYYWSDGECDISWYEDDVRFESVRWTKDRRRAFLLDLVTSKKEQISLVRAANIVKAWQEKAQTFD